MDGWTAFTNGAPAMPGRSRHAHTHTHPSPPLVPCKRPSTPTATDHHTRESQKLFVVNHAYAKGGERIDVFRVLVGRADGKVDRHPNRPEASPCKRPTHTPRQPFRHKYLKPGLGLVAL